MKYKGIKSLIELCGWIFFIGIPLGIWNEQYRWRIISTALFSIFISIVLTSYLSSKEEGN